MADNAIQTFPFDNSAARLRYFLGQVLTQRDLQLEQSYHLMLQRLVQREAFGTGTVVGLEVRSTSADGGTASDTVFVEPGLGFDPDGRELILEREVPIVIAEPPVTAESTAFPGTITTNAQLASAVADRFLGASLDAFDANELDRLAAALTAAGLFDSTPSTATLRDALAQIPVPDATAVPVVSPPELLREWLFDQLVGVTYVAIAYREAATDPAPANLDASCCGERVCFASRTQEGITLLASSSPFAVPRDPFVDFKISLDTQFLAQIQAGASTQLDCHSALCSALVSGRAEAPPWRGVPAVTASCADIPFPVLPLAKVAWRRFSSSDPTAPQFLSVDNCTFRPLAPGLPALRALLEALTGCATPDVLSPRIIAISPVDGAEVPVTSTGVTAEQRLSLLAHADASLAMGSGSALTSAWQIVFYPAAGTDSIKTFPTGGGSDGPGGTTVSVAFENPGSGSGTDIRISFTGGDEFPAGTYVWRLPNATTSSSVLVAQGTSRQLDGEPNPQGAVPSGDGKPGGAFEARFFVRV